MGMRKHFREIIGYFLLKIKFLTKGKREFTAKFAIFPNAYYTQVKFFSLKSVLSLSSQHKYK